MSRKPLNIGVCGVGTVGLATIEILRDHSETLLAQSGQAMVVSHVGARREHPNHDYGEARVSRDVFDVARDPDVDVLVELIGGTSAAYDLIKRAIQQGKHIVTANKALIAEHAKELIAMADAAAVLRMRPKTNTKSAVKTLLSVSLCCGIRQMIAALARPIPWLPCGCQLLAIRRTQKRTRTKERTGTMRTMHPLATRRSARSHSRPVGSSGPHPYP